MRKVNVSVRLDAEDVDRLEALAKRFGNVATASTLARAAVRLGLGTLEREGLAAVEALAAKPTKKGRK